MEELQVDSQADLNRARSKPISVRQGLNAGKKHTDTLDAVIKSAVDPESVALQDPLKAVKGLDPKNPAPLEQGNIDLENRPLVKNPDGSVSTVRSASVNLDGVEILLPTISEDGRVMTIKEAVDAYRETGKHLGKFKSAEDASKYAQRLHEEQAKYAKQKYEELTGTELGFVDAVWGALPNSPLGLMLRSSAPARHYTPTSQEYDKLFQEVQGNVQALERALDDADSFEGVEENIRMHLDAREYYKRLSNDGFLTQFAAGIPGALGNPVDVLALAVPGGLLAKGASTAARVATRTAFSVAGGLASAEYESQFSGIDQDIFANTASLLALSLGIEGVSAGISKFKNRGTQNASLNETLAKGLEPSKEQLERFSSVIKKDPALVDRLADGITRASSFFTDFSSKRFMRSNVSSEDGKAFFRKIDNKFEEGEIDPATGKVRRYTTEEESVFDVVEDMKRKDQLVENEINDLERQIPSSFDQEELNHYINLKLRGIDASGRGFNPEFDACQPLQKLITKEKQLYAEKGQAGVANGIMGKHRGFDTYAPTSPSKNKMADYMEKHGGEKKGRKLLQKNLVDGVLNHPAYRQLFIEEWANKTGKTLQANKEGVIELTSDELKEFKSWLNTKARNTIYGWLDQRKSDKPLKEGESTEFSFQKSATPWNLGYFGDDNFNLLSLMENHNDTRIKYNNRFNGVYAVNKVFNGGTYDTLMETVDKLTEDYYLSHGRNQKKADKFRQVAEGMVNRIYGLGATSNTRELTFGDALCDSLRNMAFGTYNTYMGLLNYTDTANAIMNFGWSFLPKSLPVVHDIIGRWGRGGFTADDFAYLKAQHLGEEVADALGCREIMRRALKRYENIPRWMARIVGGTEVFAQKVSPGSYLLRESQRNIVETAQASTFGAIALQATGHKLGKGNFIRDVDWDRMNVSKADQKAFWKEMKEYFKVDSDGHPSVNHNHKLSMKSRMILRRVGDYVADTSIQRHTYRDMFTFENSTNPFIRLAMQFKTFSLDSVSKRLLQLQSQSVDEGSLSAITAFTIAGGLSSAVTMATVMGRALGKSEEEKKDYYKHIFGKEDLSKMTMEEIATSIVDMGIMRNPYLAAPSMLLNSVGIGDMYKSTASLNGRERPFGTSIDLPRGIGNLFPSARIANDTLESVFGLGWMGYDAITGDLDKTQRKAVGRAVSKTINLMPQIPAWTPTAKQFLSEELKEAGYK